MVTYRTAGPWGPGKGSNLTPAEVDENFWELVQDIADKAVQGVGIADVIVIGNEFTFVLTDHTLLGPYTLPVATFRFRGQWEPLTQYFINDIITDGGATYLVVFNHTSDATFDPGDNDGHGNNFYGLLLAAALQAWDFGFAFTAEPAADVVIQIVPVTRAIVIPADMIGSVGFCEVPPLEDYVVELRVDDVVEGTITAHPDGTFSFSTGGNAVAVAAGQVVTFKTQGIDSPLVGVSGMAVTVYANQNAP
jgi:hypothetical protein